MTQPFPCVGRTFRASTRRNRGLAPVLFVCLAVAGATVAALDRRGLTKHTLSSGRVDPVSAPANSAPVTPTPIEAGPALFEPGIPAPPISLVEARTGERISLDDYRGRMPVVLLLSSFG